MTDVREALRGRMAGGGLDHDGPAPARRRSAVAAVADAAAVSLAEGFAVWSQTMVLDYLDRAGPHPARTTLRAALADGTRCGSSGMAGALADLTGQRELPLVAHPVDGGWWRLDGRVPWASNLFDGGVLVAPARTADGGRLIALVELDATGVEVTPSSPLLALDDTATGAVGLAGVDLPVSGLLGRDLADFVAGCRPTMLLAQAAMAHGVAGAALAAAGEAGETGVSITVRRRHHEEAGEHLLAAAGSAGTTTTAAARTRIDAVRRAVEAVQIEAVAVGGAGYAADGATARRWREALFLPVQAPSARDLETLALARS